MPEMNRRKFVKSAAGVAAATSAVMIGPKTWAGANDRIRVAVLGVNGRGGSHISGFSGLGQSDNVQLAALCDPDKNVLARRASAYEKESGAKLDRIETDLRAIMDDKTIDAVSIATPNHWHALASLWAIQAGKDVYVEKPGSHNIFEGQRVSEAAKKHGRIVQVGSQSRSNEGMREGIQKLKDGAIGEVYMAKGLCYKWRNTIGKVDGPTPIPEGVDYNLWLGPAAEKPLMRKRLHYDWHWQWEYGSGDIGNQGIHEMDKARWGLGVELPTEVQSTGGHYMFDDDQETPNVQLSTFRYPDQKKLLVFEVRHWITNAELGDADNNVGNLFYGSEGYMMMPNYSSYQIFLGQKREPQPAVNKGGDHFQNFIQAMRSRKTEDLHAPYEEVRKSAALVHMANISYRLGGAALAFDPAKERFVDNKDANKMLTREYRKGFVVPEKV